MDRTTQVKDVATVLAAIEAAGMFTENEEVLGRAVIRLQSEVEVLQLELRASQEDYVSAAHKLDHAHKLCARERAKWAHVTTADKTVMGMPLWLLDLEAILNGGVIALTAVRP